MVVGTQKEFLSGKLSHKALEMSRDMFWRRLKELHDTICGQEAGTTHELKRQYFTMSFMNPVMMT
jgi:biotin operon repressor